MFTFTSCSLVEIETRRDVLFGKMGVGLSAEMKKVLGKGGSQSE